MTEPVAPEYVAARTALLDALGALGAQRGSVVLIGSQAIYHHTGDAGLVVPPMTTDADLALNTDLVTSEPELAQVLLAAGFTSGGQPGHWTNARGVAVDVMVAPHQSGRSGSHRSWKHHEEKVARVGDGLAPCLIDFSQVWIAAFDLADNRTFELRIANLPALLVAKTIKVRDRLGNSDKGQTRRVVEKDALDILRILTATRSQDIVQNWTGYPVAGPEIDSVTAATTFLRQERAGQDRLPDMAQAAASGDPTIGPSLRALIDELLVAAS